MIVLTLRTDKPETELGLFENEKRLAQLTWHAHRELSMTIHQKIEDLLKEQGMQLADMQGIVCFQGPGSFTGLRIGLTVANALAYGLSIPIVASKGEKWEQHGINRLHAGEDDQIALPHYGRGAHITMPKR